MLKLATFNSKDRAKSFADYMSSHGIHIQIITEDSGEGSLWLEDLQHEENVRKELKNFLNKPYEAKYQVVSWKMAEPTTSKIQYKKMNPLTLSKKKVGPLTLAVMIITTLVFILLELGQFNRIFTALHFPVLPDQRWQLWRWISHSMLHFSTLHFIFNLLWWWKCAGEIERKLGSGKLFFLFTASAVASGAAQAWYEGVHFGGLSGIIYAFLGYIWIVNKNQPQKGLYIESTIFGGMLIWLVIGFIQPFIPIANIAHLSGLIAGISLGFLEVKK